MVELHHPDGALDADVDDAGDGPARLQRGPEMGLDGGDLIEPGLALEQIERGVGGGAGQRVGHVGRPVHQRLGAIVVEEALEDSRARRRRREAERAAGERLADAHDIGRHAGLVAGEQAPGAPEPGGDLVGDQQHVVGGAGVANGAKRRGRVELHAARRLDQRLDDDRRGLAGDTA